MTRLRRGLFLSRPRPIGIRAMLTASVIGVSLLLEAALIVVLVGAVRPALLSGLDRRGNSIAAELSDHASLSLAVGDTLRLWQAAMDLAGDEEVSEIHCHGPDGRALMCVPGAGFGRWKTPWGGSLLQESRAPVRMAPAPADNDVFSVEAQSSRPPDQATNLGTIEVIMNAGRIHLSIFRWIALTLLLVCAFGAILARNGVLTLVKPILRLVDAAERVGCGEHGVRVQDPAFGELGRLQTAFNQMVVGLEAHETSLREKNAELEASLSRTETLLAELKQAQDAMVNSEKLRAIGEMASGVAHDFNNVLAAVIGRAQILEMMMKRGPVAVPEIQRNLSIIRQAAEDGAHTVQRLQQYTRGGRKTAHQPVDLVQLVTQVIEMASPRFHSLLERKGKRIEVSLDMAPGSIVAGQESDLREVLMNLIFNAVDAMPEGGQLAFITETGEDRIRLHVRDTGSGMTEETRRRAFDPFFTTKGSRGNGLGLSSALGIVRGLGGDISIESQAGRGSCFTLDLPRWKGAHIVKVIDPAQATPAGRLGCLIVDDNGTALDNLRQILDHLQQRVTAVDTGQQACEIASARDFDLIITDLVMHDVDGWQVAGAARSRNPSARIVLCTGWADQLDPARVAEAGIWRVLAKPYTMDQIQELLQAAGREDRQQLAA